jgi:hypothetical protein
MYIVFDFLLLVRWISPHFRCICYVKMPKLYFFDFVRDLVSRSNIVRILRVLKEIVAYLMLFSVYIEKNGETECPGGTSECPPLNKSKRRQRKKRDNCSVNDSTIPAYSIQKLQNTLCTTQRSRGRRRRRRKKKRTSIEFTSSRRGPFGCVYYSVRDTPQNGVFFFPLWK